MRELISKLLLALDEAWLDHGADIIDNNTFSERDERLEQFLFETERKLADLGADWSCKIKPRIALPQAFTCRCCRTPSRSTSAQSSWQTASNAMYQTKEVEAMLRDSRATLERSRALLLRAAAKAPRSTLATDGTLLKRASGLAAKTGRMRHIQANR